MTWDVSVPAGSDPISQGDDVIRALKTDLQTALRGNGTDGDEAKFPGSDTANPIFRYRGLKGTTGARPTAGQYGLYFDTTRQVLQRDNGASWDDVAGGVGIVSGTKMVFYQASAPTGWTAVAVNDKFLRVVTAGGTGGTTGGTVAASTSLAHSHTVNSHTHGMSSHTHTGPAHTHTVPRDSWGTANTNVVARLDVSNVSANPNAQAGGDNTSGSSGTGDTGSPSTNTSEATAPGTDSHFAGAFAYSDVVIATKD